jgi:hypothetical protein
LIHIKVAIRKNKHHQVAYCDGRAHCCLALCDAPGTHVLEAQLCLLATILSSEIAPFAGGA